LENGFTTRNPSALYFQPARGFFNMLIHSVSQLLTISGSPQRGRQLGNLGLIENGAVVIEGDTIIATGPSDEMRVIYNNEETFDAGGRVVVPGFVDPHTHLVWAGDRAVEFEMRLQGKSYLEIMESGGGIRSTVKETRRASKGELRSHARSRLKNMFVHGTTTAEAKTGYGLDTDTELKLLEVVLELDAEGPLDLVPTFLGAHAIPPEFEGDPDGYTEFVCSQMLPTLKDWWQSHFPEAETPPLPFVDVFCETGAFSLGQSRQILETAKSLGFRLKIHADEFDNLGGVALAVDLGAASVDHLVVTSPEEVAALGRSETVAVSLPCTPFGLAEEQYTPADKIREADGILAIATDMNPGTAWCENMQFAIALACRYLKLTPAQAIVAATINAAAAIGVQDKVGSLNPGKQADLLVMDVPDYRHLGYRFGTNLVHTVFKKGKRFSVRGLYD
jgi:imidazolonepropionase